MTVDASRYPRSIRARRLRGAAALMEAIDLIGATNSDDHQMAKVIVENELELREVLSFALRELGSPDYVDGP